MPERRERRKIWKVLSPILLVVVIVGGLLSGLVILAGSITSFDLFSDFTEPTLPPPPPPSQFGTVREIGTRGDDPNPRVLYKGAYPSNSQTQERRVGGLPARFSGYTTWVRSVTRVPARSLVDVYPGAYLRVRVTVFNRDENDAQHVCACDFYVYTRQRGRREADAVPAPSLSPYTTMARGKRLDGDVYLYVGTATGPFFVVYNPDAHVSGHSSQSEAVWRVPNI